MSEAKPKREYRDLDTIHTVGFAHELANICDASLVNIKHASFICNAGIENLDELTWSNLNAYVNQAAFETEILQYEAMNLLSSLHEEFKSSLSRPKYELTSPSELLRSMLPIFETRLQARSIDVTWDTHNSMVIPPIRLDVHAIRRTIFNVLANAVKYSYRSGNGRMRFIRIRESLPSSVGPWWQIMIENYGVGILNEELPHVFTAGVRGSLAIKDNVHGAGIGLSEAKRCMESIGGNIRIASEHDHGDTYKTRVLLHFPRRFNKP